MEIFPINEGMFPLNGSILNKLPFDAYIHNIIGSSLIHKVVKPVGKQQIRMPPPAYDRLLGIIVIPKVVYGHIDGQSEIFISQIFIY